MTNEQEKFEFIREIRVCLPGLDEPPPGYVMLPNSRRLRAGQLLFALGSRVKCFYLVSQGEICTKVLGENGEASEVDRVTAGQLLGLAAFVTGHPSSYEAEASASSHVWAITPDNYQSMMDHWPGFARALMRTFAQRFEDNLQRLTAARHLSARARCWQTLRQALSNLSSQPDRSGWHALDCTQQELADRAGLSRQTVNELLTRAQSRGLVQLRYRHMQVHERLFESSVHQD